MRIIAALVVTSSLLAVCSAQSPPLDRLLFDDVDLQPEAAPSLERVPAASKQRVTTSAGNAPLVIQLRMVKKRLSGGEVDVSTVRLQEQILAKLEAMKDATSYAGPKTDADSPGESANGGDESLASKQGHQPGNTDGTVTESPIDSPGSNPDGLETPAAGDWREGREKLLERAWGHLPPATVDQLRAGSSTQFLPEFREQIESYFKRLAELPADDR